MDELAGIDWFCEYGQTTDTEEKERGAFPASGCNVGRLQSLLLFHDCVNPDTLESAYSGRHNLLRVNCCPEGMQRIPQLRFSIRFDHNEALPNGWAGEAPLELASGPSYSWHGDFMNAWLPEAGQNMLLANDKEAFMDVTGPLTERPSCTPGDADPERGTDDYEESLLFMDLTNDDEEASEEASEEPEAEPVEPVATSTSALSEAPTSTLVKVDAPQTAETTTATTTPDPTLIIAPGPNKDGPTQCNSRRAKGKRVPPRGC